MGWEEQKKELLPRMAAGEAIGCFGLTEPECPVPSGGEADPGTAGRWSTDPARAEDVDHEKFDRQGGDRVGATDAALEVVRTRGRAGANGGTLEFPGSGT